MKGVAMRRCVGGRGGGTEREEHVLTRLLTGPGGEDPRLPAGPNRLGYTTLHHRDR